MARSRKFLAGAVGVAALALAAAGVGTTGAYFSDSHPGSIKASTGAVIVNPTSSLDLNFTKLLPGEFSKQAVSYTAAGSGTEDIWLVFPTLPTSDTAFLNGQKGTLGEKPALGRYGHFAVMQGNNTLFTSYNLTTAANPGGTDSCGVDTNGHGGNAEQATSATTGYPPYCPVPNAIKLGDNLSYGQTGAADITFGYTKLLRADTAQNQGPVVIAPFRLVATQHGILPNDVNNVTR